MSEPAVSPRKSRTLYPRGTREFTTHLPFPEYERLKKIAEEEGRSVRSQARMFILAALSGTNNANKRTG